MHYSDMGRIAEDNAKLLFQLSAALGTKGLGSVCGFFEVDARWCCPSCHREKKHIARADKNNDLLCALHWHHDHFGDLAHDNLAHYKELRWEEGAAYQSLRSSFVRFQPTLICGDCNVAEGAAKMSVPTPSGFTFTPFEISTFIIPAANVPHKIDRQKAADVYDKAKPAMSVYGSELRQVVAAQKGDTGNFEQVGGAAWRVLKDVHAKMKAKSDDA